MEIDKAIFLNIGDKIKFNEWQEGSYKNVIGIINGQFPETPDFYGIDKWRHFQKKTGRIKMFSVNFYKKKSE